MCADDALRQLTVGQHASIIMCVCIMVMHHYCSQQPCSLGTCLYVTSVPTQSPLSPHTACMIACPCHDTAASHPLARITGFLFAHLHRSQFVCSSWPAHAGPSHAILHVRYCMPWIHAMHPWGLLPGDLIHLPMVGIMRGLAAGCMAWQPDAWPSSQMHGVGVRHHAL